MSRAASICSIIFDRVGKWFVLGEALSDVVSSGDIDDRKSVQIGILDVGEEYLIQRLSVFGISVLRVGDGCLSFGKDGLVFEVLLFSPGKKGKLISPYRSIVLLREWVECSEEVATSLRKRRSDMSGQGVWRRSVADSDYLQLPFRYGTVLDETLPGWYLRSVKRPYPAEGDIFFDEKRKENGRQLISKLSASADSAGIGNLLFAGFGTCLGYLMYGDFIPKDRDMDMCILSDGMDKNQYDLYAMHAYNTGGSAKPTRWEVARRGIGEYYWISVGYKNPISEHGVKSCNWFFFSWNNLWLHSKGGNWVNQGKIRGDYNLDDDAVALGMPKKYIERLVAVDLNGVSVKIPEKAGTCCDFWYPGWSPRGEGASAHKIKVIIKNWIDRNSWRIDG